MSDLEKFRAQVEGNLRTVLNSNIGNKLTAELATGIFGVISAANGGLIAELAKEREKEEPPVAQGTTTTTVGTKRIIPRQVENHGG